ncbi:MAG: imelysin family protein [Saprospiraceae bacterium]
MKIFSKSVFVALAILSLSLTACKDSDDTINSNPCSVSFDQKAMFANLADNIIIPSYLDLKTKVEALTNEMDVFLAEPNATNLTTLRATWLTAYLSWQACAYYEFGPAENIFLRNSLNNFPVNQSGVEQNIIAGTYDFDKPDNYDKGFPALDYLLFGLAENDADLLNKYTNDTDAAKYKTYAQALVVDMKTKVEQTYTSWTTDYRDQFVSNTGTAAGTSLSLVINNLNQNYEFIKREKLGTPVGIVFDIPNPTTVEAYYSGNAIKLATAALEAARNLYLGGTGLGLDDNLNAADARKGSETLDAVIQARFTEAIAAVKELNDPLDQEIQNDRASVVNAYNQVTKQVVPLKTDMPSALCVSITYIDNPSDSD